MARLLIVHGGGPTAVINSSLYGVITEAKRHSDIDGILAADGGMSGLLKEKFIDLNKISDTDIDKLLCTPGSAIGTSRDPIEAQDYENIPKILHKHGIKYILLNGGNGTMDTCERIHRSCVNQGIYCIGIPKTMDNDLSCIDHSPGFASAARYIAKSVNELCADVAGLAIHVVVIEALGRNAGWVTAASALARGTDGNGPDMILLPEIPFDEVRFLNKVKEIYKRKSGVVIVCSEGLRYEDGTPITPIAFKSDRAEYFGDCSAHLSKLIISKLGIKSRSEKPGLIGRCDMDTVSEVDRIEAIEVGKRAVIAAISKETGKMIGIVRKDTKEYEVDYPLISTSDVMMHERVMSKGYFREDGYGVTQEYIDWIKPILGDELPSMISFRSKEETC